MGKAQLHVLPVGYILKCAQIKTGKEAKDVAERFLCPKCNDSVPSVCGKDGVPVNDEDVPSVSLVGDAPSAHVVVSVDQLDQGGVLSDQSVNFPKQKAPVWMKVKTRMQILFWKLVILFYQINETSSC